MSSTDGPTTDYKPQGEGPHSTLAGNTLDPNVNPSESSTHQEGIDHIKSNVEGGTGASSSVPSSGVTQPPASNPGADDATGGIASGSGGTSGTSAVNSPVTDAEAQSQGGIIGTVKSYLGYGSTGQQKEATDSTTGEDTATTGDALSSGAGETSATTGAAAAGGAAAAAGGAAAAEGASGASATDAEPSTTAKSANKGLGTDPADQTRPSETPKDSDVTTGAPPTESADPHTQNTAVGGGEADEEGHQSSGQEYKPDQGKSEAATGHLRENKESIPTAGGKKLGEEHWGESKIVPDNPKPKSEEGNEANVSSPEGQPTDQVRDNTNANTGGAKPPGQSSDTTGSGNGGSDDQEKEKLVDKIKNKLHIGHKS